VGDGNGLFADAFAFFAANFFTDIANAFALVRFRRIETADFGSELTDELFINAFNLDLGVLNDSDVETRWDGVKERMGTTEGKVEVSTLDRGTKTDAVDFKILHEALRNADDHVLNEAARGAVEGFVLTMLGSAGDDNGAVCVGERDTVRKSEVEFALRAFDGHSVAIQFDSNLFRERDWFKTDS
jgi:hypothetical protein